MNTVSHDEFGIEAPRSQSNTLGLVGFILAFCLSPVGLLLSLIGLSKAPRGFAIAGVVVGLIGTAIWAVVLMGVIKLGQAAMKAQELTAQLTSAQSALAAAKGTDGTYPADVSGLTPPLGNDPWGRPLAYERTPDSKGYLLSSQGGDGAPGTADDVVVNPFMGQELIYAGAYMALAGQFIDSFGGGGEATEAINLSRDMLLIEALLNAAKASPEGLPPSLDKAVGISPKQLNDPWGQPYVYTPATDGKSFLLKSYGPDKQPDTQDDMDSARITAGIRQNTRMSGGRP